jgi:hypothetical protein
MPFESDPNLVPLELGALLAVKACLVGDDLCNCRLLLLLGKPSHLSRSAKINQAKSPQVMVKAPRKNEMHFHYSVC